MSLWDKLALRWGHIGAPLRPCEQDVSIMQKSIDELYLRTQKPRISPARHPESGVAA
jgi:hypothetical protein